MNRLTGRHKNNVTFIIGDRENKLHTDDFAVSKFISMSKTLAASIPTVPFTTEGLANNEKSLCFYPTHFLEVSKIVRNLKNHNLARLDGLTAKLQMLSLLRLKIN